MKNRFKNLKLSLILYGDTPLISYKSLKKSFERFKKMNLDLCILSMTPPIIITLMGD